MTLDNMTLDFMLLAAPLKNTLKKESCFFKSWERKRGKEKDDHIDLVYELGNYAVSVLQQSDDKVFFAKPGLLQI